MPNKISTVQDILTDTMKLLDSLEPAPAQAPDLITLIRSNILRLAIMVPLDVVWEEKQLPIELSNAMKEVTGE